MSEFSAERAVRSHSFTLELPARRAFALFEPEGERAWAAGWNPRYLHPRDGRAERRPLEMRGELTVATTATLHCVEKFDTMLTHSTRC